MVIDLPKLSAADFTYVEQAFKAPALFLRQRTVVPAVDKKRCDVVTAVHKTKAFF